MATTADFKKYADGLLKQVNNKAWKVDACIKALLPSADDVIIQYREMSTNFKKRHLCFVRQLKT